eukprot:gene18545-biopygen2430
MPLVGWETHQEKHQSFQPGTGISCRQRSAVSKSCVGMLDHSSLPSTRRRLRATRCQRAQLTRTTQQVPRRIASIRDQESNPSFLAVEPAVLMHLAAAGMLRASPPRAPRSLRFHPHRWWDRWTPAAAAARPPRSFSTFGVWPEKPPAAAPGLPG